SLATRAAQSSGCCSVIAMLALIHAMACKSITRCREICCLGTTGSPARYTPKEVKYATDTIARSRGGGVVRSPDNIECPRCGWSPLRKARRTGMGLTEEGIRHIERWLAYIAHLLEHQIAEPV